MNLIAFPFFEGLLPEGMMLDALLRQSKPIVTSHEPVIDCRHDLVGM